MKKLPSLLAFLFLPCLLTQAAMNVGDKPTLKFKSADNKPIDLSQLKGKLVIVDFWATWCGPCMGEAPHMVSINQKYAPKGLQLIGISLDQDKSKMLEVAKSSGFVWPQYFDGLVWKNHLAQEWGVDSIPRTFLIGPDGTILWTGHPAEIDKVLAKAFKEHPPVLTDPKLAEEAKSLLDQVEAKLSDNDMSAAMKALAQIPPAAAQDEALAKRLTSAQDKIADYAKTTMSDVDHLITDKKFLDAMTKLRDLSSALAGTPLAAQAKEKLQSILSDPAARQAVLEASRQAKSEEALTLAQKLQSAGKDLSAYQAFKEITQQFKNTPAAAPATDALAAYEKDPAFMEKLKSAGDPKAKAALSLADNYARSGKLDIAKQKYQAIITQYPNTPYSAQAQTALDSLNQ
jgi:thiol-disulfide isomerase/thioredoxin